MQPKSLSACEFTACVCLSLSLPSTHRRRPARWVVTLLASELKTANDKSWNNRKIIQIWLVSRVLHKQQSFPVPPACFPANVESICPPVFMPCSCNRVLHSNTHTQKWKQAHRASPPLRLCDLFDIWSRTYFENSHFQLLKIMLRDSEMKMWMRLARSASPVKISVLTEAFPIMVNCPQTKPIHLIVFIVYFHC